MSSFVLDIVLLGPPAAYKDDADSVNVDLMRPESWKPSGTLFSSFFWFKVP